MNKLVISDIIECMLSIVFFAMVSVVLMFAFIVSFRRKDDSLLPG